MNYDNNVLLILLFLLAALNSAERAAITHNAITINCLHWPHKP